VFCECSAALARSRYAKRAADRHPGHLDAEHVQANDLWSGALAVPVDGGWPVVRIDTAGVVDHDDIVRRVVEAISAIRA
jgi:hypothetical protein